VTKGGVMELVVLHRDEVKIYEFIRHMHYEWAEEFKRELNAQLDRGERKFLIVIQPHNHINKDGVQAILEAHKLVAIEGGRLAVANIDGELNAFSHLGFHKIIPTYATRKEAHDSFAPEGR
jgi:anti-anti-sigma regulatory factor